MGMIREGAVGIGLMLVLGGFVASVEPVAAQMVTGERLQCECVDADGDPIENCTCIRGGDLGLESFTLSGLGLDRRAQIGVYIEMNQDDASVGGVGITDVMDGSPAAEAGLIAGDVVVSVDGRSVFDELDPEAEEDLDPERSLATQRFAKIVGALDPDEEVEMVVLRDGSQRMLRVAPEPATNAFFLRGLDGDMEFDLDFDVEDMRELRESLEVAGESLRGLNFRFEGDREMLVEQRRLEETLREERIREELERVEQQAGRLREMTRGREAELRRIAEQMEEQRIESSRQRRVLFPRADMDPCVRLHTESEGEMHVLVLGAGGCIDGVRLTEMNDGLATYFGTDSGVLVTEVVDGSSLGLVAGDVILRVGARDVEDSGDVRRILGSYDMEETVTFRVRRENREIQVTGTRRPD